MIGKMKKFYVSKWIIVDHHFKKDKKVKWVKVIK